MRRKLLLSLSLLTSLVPIAGRAALPSYEVDIDGIEIGAFCALVFHDIERVPYVLAPEAYADHRAISLHLRGARADFHAGVAAYLDDLGYSLTVRGGTVVVGPKKPAEEKPEEHETLVYYPRYRDASYLIEQARGAGAGVTFASDRSIHGSLSTGVAVPSLGNAATGQPGQQPAAQLSTVPPTSAAGLADQQADVVVATGRPAELVKVRDLLGQLDRAGGEVVVRATVFEVQVTDQDTGAVQLAAKLLGSRFSVSYGPTPDSSVVNQVSVSAGGLQAVVGALATDAHFKSLSSSSARVQSGKSATFTAGESDPVLGSVSYQGATGQPVQSVEYMNAGVILQVKPRAYEDLIALDLHQEVSSFTNTTTGVNNSPTIIKRALDSSLSLASGEVIVLGGLVADQRSDNRAGLWFLPRFLDSTSNGGSRREIVLVLQVERLRGPVGPKGG